MLLWFVYFMDEYIFLYLCIFSVVWILYLFGFWFVMGVYLFCVFGREYCGEVRRTICVRFFFCLCLVLLVSGFWND